MCRLLGNDNNKTLREVRVLSPQVVREQERQAEGCHDIGWTCTEAQPHISPLELLFLSPTEGRQERGGATWDQAYPGLPMESGWPRTAAQG